MEYIRVFLNTFYDYTVEIVPYFVLAALITSLIQTYVSLSWLRKALKNEKTAPIFTGFLGGLLPVCSCSMIPVAHLINNFSKTYAPVLAFLVVAPVVSPVTVTLTFAFFGFEITLFRVFGVFLFAMLLAYVASTFYKKERPMPLLGEFNSAGTKGKIFLRSFKFTLSSTGRYLLLGMFIAALIKAILPQGVVNYVAGTSLSYPLIALVSVPIYVCSGEDVPIAKALLQVGFTHGNALTFMLGGSGICVPTILATMSFLPKRIVFLYAVSWFFMSWLAGLLFDLIF
ncbi:MAG: permease [Aquificaceae bacterium]